MRYLALFLLAITLSTGCANLNKTAYQVTAATITTVDQAENVYAELYSRGLVSPENQDKVHKAIDSYNAAVLVEKDIVVSALTTSTQPNETLLKQAATAVSAAGNSIIALVQTLVAATK